MRALILVMALIVSSAALAAPIDCTQTLTQQDLEAIKNTVPLAQVQKMAEICSTTGDQLSKRAHQPDDGRTDRIELLLNATTAYGNATALALVISESKINDLTVSTRHRR